MKDARVTGEISPGETVEADPPNVLTAEELAALSFDEWLAYGRSLVSFDEGPSVEELIRQGEEAVADEWWERFHRDG